MQWGATSRRQKFWDFRAACNFIGGGAGSSLLVWAALGLLAGLPYFPIALVGLLLVAAGLFMVWLEIGKPWRAFRVFFRPQTSWMTREGIVAMPLFALGAIGILFDADLEPLLSTPSPVVAAIPTAALSLLFLYCQLRILNSARGLPAWSEPRAMPLLGLSGLTEGLGIYLLLTAILGITPLFMLAIMVILIGARAISWRAYVSGLRRAGAPQMTLAALIAMGNRYLISGHMLPVILLGLVYFWPDMIFTFSALAGISATLAGWWFKSVLMTRAAYIPGTVVPHTPVRGRRPPPAVAKRIA